MRYSWKIFLVCAVLVAGCQAEPIYRHPYHAYDDDDDDDDDIDFDFDFDGDVDFEVDAELDFGVDVDVDADIDIASKIGNVFDRVADVTSGSIVISRDPHRTYPPSSSTYPDPVPTRTIRPTRTVRPPVRRTDTPSSTAQPTRTPRPSRTARPTASPSRTAHPTVRPTSTSQRQKDRRPKRTKRSRRDRGGNSNTNYNNNGNYNSNTNYNDNSSGSGNYNTNYNDNSSGSGNYNTNYNDNSSGSGNYNTNYNDNSSGSGNYNDNTNYNDNSSGSGNYNNNGSNISPMRLEIGELFSLTRARTLSVEDTQGNAVRGALLRLGGSSLRKLFLTQELSDHYLVVRSTSGVRRVPLTVLASSVIWTMTQADNKVMLDIEGGLLPDHMSAHIALKLHLVTVSGRRLVSAARTASLAVRNGRGSVSFTLLGKDANLNYSNGCYRWVIETVSAERAMFGGEFGGRCR